MNQDGPGPVIHVPARLRVVATGPPGGPGWQARAYVLIIVPRPLTLRGKTS
jgi:hypothetical protein